MEDHEWAAYALKLEKDLAEARHELDMVRGALFAQEEREQSAAVACGVPWEQHGCDWPDAVADVVVALRKKSAVKTAKKPKKA